MTNTIIVTIDSLRADHCSAYGYDRETTPFLDSISTTTFSNAYANAPYTPASVPSFLTGTLPLEDGHVVYSGANTLPEYLSDTSYTSGIVYNNAQISRFGYQRKFDIVSDRSVGDSQDDVDTEVHELLSGPGVASRMKQLLLSNKRVATYIKDVYYRFEQVEIPHSSDSQVIDDAVEFVKAMSDPYVLWIHLMNPHYPYYFDEADFERFSDEPYDANRYSRIHSKAMTHVTSGNYIARCSPAERQYLIDGYDASIRGVDRELERLVDVIDESMTQLFITADHGEELWERGHFGHAARRKKPRDVTLYNEMLHIPLWVHGANVNSKTVSRSVSLIDVLPTVLDNASVDWSHLRGRSLCPLLEGTATDDDDRPPVIAHATSPGDPEAFHEQDNSHYLGAIIEKQNKYVHYEVGNNEIFDLASDPDERKNRINTEPELATRLEQLLTETISLDDGDGAFTNAADTNGPVKERLKKLGYMN